MNPLLLLLLGWCALFLVGADSTPPAAQKIIYISPNNDGVQDTLTVPFTVKDKRYITEWRLMITTENGELVRTIFNKENRPTTFSMQELWKIITTPKQSVTVPPFVVWDGVMENGKIAPDGTYLYYITATDDNGNRNQTAKATVIVDNTPPEITIVQPSAADKFFGAGAKTQLRIRQSGSHEDKWMAAIKGIDDTIARSWTFTDAAPNLIEWDGKNNDGIPVDDGVYGYSIESTDRAGNKSASARVNNIVYSGDKPVVSITLSGSRYFSPKTASEKKTITLVPNIPAPSEGNLLQNWKIEVVDGKNEVKRTWRGSGRPEKPIVFDGYDERPRLLDDGDYRARVTASYLNGYQTPEVFSPVFTLDRTEPKAVLKMRDDIFSPDGNGDKDIFVIEQLLSTEQTSWHGEIIDNNNTVVRHYELGGKPPLQQIWDGLDDSGRLLPDGTYRYQVDCTDSAGNFNLVVSQPFTLDTSATELLISVSPDAFSPNGDGYLETVTIYSSAKSESGVVSYTLNIKDSGGKTVRTFKGDGTLPGRQAWDGKTDAGVTAPDGTYSASLTAVSRNGSSSTVNSRSWVLDTVAPQVQITAAYTLFSPDYDSSRDTVPLSIKSSSEKLWTGTIKSASGKAVRNFVWYAGQVPSFNWDGTDDSGNVVADGLYSFTLSSRDEAGNSGSATFTGITVDTRPVRAWVTTLHETIAPNGRRNMQQFTITPSMKDGIDNWRFAIIDAENVKAVPVRQWQGTGNTIPGTLGWDGRTAAGTVAEGVFIGLLTVDYTKGNHLYTEAPNFVCTGKAPALDVKTSPDYFSPDNDGIDDDCFIDLAVKTILPLESWTFEIFDPQNIPFWNAEGKSKITERLVWDGYSNTRELVQSAMEYPYTFSVTDIEGQTSRISGKIPVDVLVVRDGDKYKMQIPAIIFRADHADFVSKARDRQQGLDQSVIDNNNRVLKRVAEILNRFKDYSIVIEGHAHNLSGDPAEETMDNPRWGKALVPLSKDRADFVKSELVKLGISAKRMSTEGVGGNRPVAPREDRDSWWKDRRVEFILNK